MLYLPTLRVMVLACNIYHVGIWYAHMALLLICALNIIVIYFNGLSNTKWGDYQFLSMFNDFVYNFINFSPIWLLIIWKSLACLLFSILPSICDLQHEVTIVKYQYPH